jgi:hypothetical protein
MEKSFAAGITIDPMSQDAANNQPTMVPSDEGVAESRSRSYFATLGFD